MEKLTVCIADEKGDLQDGFVVNTSNGINRLTGTLEKLAALHFVNCEECLEWFDEDHIEEVTEEYGTEDALCRRCILLLDDDGEPYTDDEEDEEG